MKRERMSRNDTREGLAQYIDENPGVSFSMLQRAFRLNEGTLRYHIDYLLGEERVRIARNGRNRCYYSRGVTRTADALNRDESRIARIIKGNPGISRSRLKGIYTPEMEDLSTVLRKLRERKLIWKVEDGGDPCYEYITERQLALEMLSIILERFLDDEMDRDTFLTLKERIEKDLED
jgi:predicted transcriptional regulator